MILLPGLRAGVKGYFKLDVIRNGVIRKSTGWFPNLITDVGLNRIGQGSYLTACHVGTNNTTPNVLDTGLAGFLAGTTTVQASSYGAQSSAPYYGWKRITYRFPTGTATGNIAEVGIASTKYSSTAVNFSRALVLDEFGSPSTVTVLADEVLDVTYELRLYPPLVDVTGSITVTGSGTHNYTARASSVTSNVWGLYLGDLANHDPGGNNNLAVYNGVINAITTTPSGSVARVSPTNIAYVNNSLQKDGYSSFGLNAGNLDGGIKSVRFETTLGIYQYELDPVIAKDNTKTLVITNRISWDRYTP